MRFSDEANLPTRFGRFRVVAVQEELTGKEHLVLMRGRVKAAWRFRCASTLSASRAMSWSPCVVTAGIN